MRRRMMRSSDPQQRGAEGNVEYLMQAGNLANRAI
jgi:hypothetical protein